MVWLEFLKTIDNADSVTLVGPLQKELVRPAGAAIYVDGGVHARQGQSSHPEISVGDGDSAPQPVDHLLPKDKDYSDLAFVLRELPAHILHLELLGFIGGRLDHQLAAFGELHKFLKAARPRTVSLSSAYRGYSSGTWDCQVNGGFSVLTIEPAMIRIAGECEYLVPSPRRFDALSSFGISNIGFGQIQFESDGPFFIIKY